MKEHLQNHIFVATLLVFMSLSLIVGTWFVHYNQSSLETKLRTELNLEREKLMSLAEITDRNGADAVIETIIVDCQRRSEFESLLVELDTLSPKELITLQTLYESCGSFYTERKALMVSKLEREYEVYTRLITLLSTLTSHGLESYEQATWQELIDIEKSRSALLTDQTRIQADIITSLIVGESVQGQKVKELVREAGEIYDLLGVHARQAKEKRDLLRT